ncbi:alpha/beta hydrolase [Catellatospora sp. NPDC049133]|jgi:pimeloyl-ACP methyl ester carboxylesterase|uniref:alpha/beta fold hydrolase n=1 Tax=Catellatospora sp. NPDC049133 TaxID=3155499 RepID=UPI0033C3BFBC
MADAKTHTLDVPGAVLHYDVRENADTTEPALLLIGSPMDARGFTTLAGYFPDRTVVTYDPRGAERSVRTPDAEESTPDVHADDLHRLIAELGGGPVDIFASSGGAVNTLALVARHPADVRILVAHEPPAGTLLPDREQALAAIRFIRDTYQAKGSGAGMAAFIAAVGHQGEFPADYAVAPDPAQFGMPAEDDGSRDDVLLGQNLISCTHYEPDLDALRAASTRIVPAVGEESAGTMAYRGGVALAERLGTTAVVFPSNHGGFMGGEFGMPGKPAEFAAKLREVLAENA